MIVLFCGVYVMMSWSNLILFIVLCDIKIEKVKFEKKLWYCFFLIIIYIKYYFVCSIYSFCDYFIYYFVYDYLIKLKLEDIKKGKID